MHLTTGRARALARCSLGVTVTCAGLVLLTAEAAQAGDPFHRVVCQNAEQPGCDVMAGTGGTTGTPSAPARLARRSDPPRASHARPCHDASGVEVPCSDPVLGWLAGDGCYYKAASPSAELQAA